MPSESGELRARREPLTTPRRQVEANQESGDTLDEDTLATRVGRAASGLAAISRADSATRARVINRLQRDRGNAYVQRLVERRSPAVGRSSAAQPLEAQTPASVQRTAAVQRDDDDQPPSSGFQLSSPSLLGESGGGARPGLLGDYQLRLDPEIRAQMRAIEMARQLLDPDAVRTALLRVQLTTPPPAPDPLAGPSVPTPGPLVPAGRGPATPREAGAGDVVSAIMAIPAIDSAITSLQTQALDRVRSDYRRLSTGERIAAITASVVIGGTALAGIASNAEARRFALEQLNGRVIPVPGLSGLSVELNTERGGVMVGLHLDVGALLPPALGFGPGSPTAIGGPPR